eukprot:55815-Eustigmatos_ZCMA.PRE.1
MPDPPDAPRRTIEEAITWLREHGDENIKGEDLRERWPITLRNLNELGGITKLRDAAFGINTTRRGRAKASHQANSPGFTILMSEEVDQEVSSSSSDSNHH